MKRDLRLDTLRGIMLIFMMIFHWPGPLRRYTHEPVGFVSAAEGFVFLSGLIAGLVYSRVLREQGPAELRRRALRRARDIYLAHILPLLAVWFVAQAWPASQAIWGGWAPAFYQYPAKALLSGVLLAYQPLYFDILPIYVLFMLIMPLLLQELEAGRYVQVLAFSTCVWAVDQWGATEFAHTVLGRWLSVNFGNFNFLAWQMLFIWGLCLGHWRSRHPVGRLFTYAPAVTVMSVAAGALFLARYRLLPANDPILYTHPLLNMATLAPLRLSYFVVWAYLLGFAAVRFPRLLIWRWPAFLGQHSLQVFAFHLILVYSARPFFPAIQTLSALEQALLTLMPLAMLTLPAYLHAEYRRLRSRVPRLIPRLFHR